MGAPQIILIVLMSIRFGVFLKECVSGNMAKNDLVIETIGKIILIGLLYWGGFFG